MTEQEHAHAIQSAVIALNKAVKEAYSEDIFSEMDVLPVTELRYAKPLHLLSVQTFRKVNP